MKKNFLWIAVCGIVLLMVVFDHIYGASVSRSKDVQSVPVAVRQIQRELEPQSESDVESWPQVDLVTRKTINRDDNQIAVYNVVDEPYLHLEEAEYSITRTDHNQCCGTVNFIYEDGSMVTESVKVYFKEGQYVEVKVPYCWDYYTTDPYVEFCENSEHTVTYYKKRPRCCEWDSLTYQELKRLVPGQYQ